MSSLLRNKLRNSAVGFGGTGTFYVNGNEVSRRRQRETFKSYISISEDDESRDSIDDLEKDAKEFFDSDIEPVLLPEERVISQIGNILKFTPFTKRTEGISGWLFVTNFKISFITASRSTYNFQAGKLDQCLIGKEDIPLTSIESIYMGFSGGKKKKITQGAVISQQTCKYLEIYCWNFQVHVFGFKFTNKFRSKNFIDSLTHYAFPHKAELLFAFDYQPDNKVEASEKETSLFRYKHDWELELQRLKCSDCWFVTDVNVEFQLADSLPEYFVVPKGVRNVDLAKASHFFEESRVPSWCYSYSNGAALVRMSHNKTDSLKNNGQRLKTFRWSTRVSSVVDIMDIIQQMTKTSIKVVNLSKFCPSLKDIQQSGEKLRELCMTDSLKEFWNKDESWLSLLEETRWLKCVARCLQTAVDVVELMVNEKKTIILQEASSYDLSCVVSCLAQLLLDPFFRTILGFQGLIQREWVVMGHPFQKRCGFVATPEDQVPVFLLFLDCVWQLLGQFPDSFAFTETYLTVLWDSLHTGLFETFLFNNQHQLLSFKQRRKQKSQMLSIWNWKQLYEPGYLTLFNNPLYLVKSHFSKCKPSVMPRKHGSDCGPLLCMPVENPQNPGDILLPVTSALAIKLWSECYLRWLSPAEIKVGGKPSHYLLQCLLTEEVFMFQHRIKQLECGIRHEARPRSDLIFSLEKTTLTAFQTNNISSSFPFTPHRTTKEQQKVFLPLGSYLKTSSIADSELADEES